MSVVRIQNRSAPFVQIDRRALENNRLSWKAKGILAYLLSRPDDWRVMVNDLVQRSTDGKAAIYSALVELEELGYLERALVREGNRLTGWDYTIYEEPRATSGTSASGSATSPQYPDFQHSEKQNTGNLNTDFLNTENQHHTNKEVTKNEVTNTSGDDDGWSAFTQGELREALWHHAYQQQRIDKLPNGRPWSMGADFATAKRLLKQLPELTRPGLIGAIKTARELSPDGVPFTLALFTGHEGNARLRSLFHQWEGAERKKHQDSSPRFRLSDFVDLERLGAA